MQMHKQVLWQKRTINQKYTLAEQDDVECRLLEALAWDGDSSPPLGKWKACSSPLSSSRCSFRAWRRFKIGRESSLGASDFGNLCKNVKDPLSYSEFYVEQKDR